MFLLVVLSQMVDFSFPTYQDDLRRIKGRFMDFKEPQEKGVAVAQEGVGAEKSLGRVAPNWGACEGEKKMATCVLEE